MKCPKCNGRGTVGYYDVDHFIDIECDRCNGSGEVSETDMTNEEYLRSCTNEELQAELWHIRYDIKSPWAGKLIDDWLKEKHE